MKCPHCPRTLDTGNSPGVETCEQCRARPPVLFCLTIALATMLLIRIAISLFDAIGHGLL